MKKPGNLSLLKNSRKFKTNQILKKTFVFFGPLIIPTKLERLMNSKASKNKNKLLQKRQYLISKRHSKFKTEKLFP